jgi:hypothetical protein
LEGDQDKNVLAEVQWALRSLADPSLDHTPVRARLSTNVLLLANRTVGFLVRTYSGSEFSRVAEWELIERPRVDLPVGQYKLALHRGVKPPIYCAMMVDADLVRVPTLWFWFCIPGPSAGDQSITGENLMYKQG